MRPSSVSIVTRLLAGLRFSAEAEILLFTMLSRPALASTQLPVQWVRTDVSSGQIRLGCETDHSATSISEVKGAISPLPIRLKSMVFN
jgi:hypothetical protein